MKKTAERKRRPFYVACGVGVDSLMMIILLAKENNRPEEILFADTGAEKPETMKYIKTLNKYLKKVGFPLLNTVYRREQFNIQSTDKEFWDELERLDNMPSLAFGMHSCSDKWKVQPQLKYLKKQAWVQKLWGDGCAVVRCVGFDASPKECNRTYKAVDYDDQKYVTHFPLQEYNLDRQACIDLIESEGLPVPVKSACEFCPAMKKHEIYEYDDTEPERMKRILKMESRALDKLARTSSEKIMPAFKVFENTCLDLMKPNHYFDVEDEMDMAIKSLLKAAKGSTCKGLGRNKSWKQILEERPSNV